MLAEDYPTDAVEFERRFCTEDACRRYLAEQRWPDGYRCPRCDHDRGWPIESRNLIQCASCDHQASLTAGTVMHGSSKPLTLWFKAIWLMVTRKTGISAKDLQRTLGLGSYQTAWTWLHKLRRAMFRPERERLTGVVEVDETMVTCENPYRTPSKPIPIQIAVEDRGDHMGRVRLRLVTDLSAETLTPPIVENVAKGATIHSDGWSGYTDFEDAGFVHHVEVVGCDRASSIEKFPLVHRVASLLQRFLLGTYQGAARWFHLQHYLEEFTFRFNRRASRSIGKIFMRLVQQAANTGHTAYGQMLFCRSKDETLPVGAT